MTPTVELSPERKERQRLVMEKERRWREKREGEISDGERKREISDGKRKETEGSEEKDWRWRARDK